LHPVASGGHPPLAQKLGQPVVVENATVRRITDLCMQNDAFARAHPLRQPGAPKAA